MEMATQAAKERKAKEKTTPRKKFVTLLINITIMFITLNFSRTL
jgi:hypothetical protein